MTEKYQVAIVDDHQTWVEGMKMILEETQEMDVLWSANNGQEAIFKCSQSQPDLILMDIRMPECDGVEATRKIKSQYPKVKIMMLTTFQDQMEIYHSIKYGAEGYLLKESTPEVMIKSILNVMAGTSVFHAGVTEKMISSLPSPDLKAFEKIAQLTDKEKAIALAVAEGLNNREMAERFYLSEGTIKNSLTRILEKLELRDRTQLAVFVLKSGYKL